MIGHDRVRMLLLVVIGVTLTARVVECGRNFDVEPYGRFPNLFEYEEFETCRRTYRDRYVYCIVRGRIVPDNESQLWRNISIYSDDSFHYDRRVLERGLCVPDCYNFVEEEALHENQYPSILGKCVNQRLQRSDEIQVEPQVEIYHCYSKSNDNPPLDALEIIFLIVMAMLILIVCYSTWYDLSLQSNQRHPEHYFSKSHSTSHNRLLTAFSIPRNIRRIGDTPNTDIRRELNFLESFRFIHMHRIVTLHIVMALVKAPKTNPDDLENLLYQVPIIHYVAEFQNYVQTFFSITGMLLAVNFLEHIRKHPQFDMKYFWERIRSRLYRVVPAYFFILLLETSISRRFMNGPLAQQMVGESRATCRHWWWNNLLFLNNYISTDQPCLIQSWYLAADLQLFIFALGCLMLIWRWPFLKKYILATGLAWGLICTTCIAYARGLPPVMTQDLKLYNEYNFGHPYFQLYQPFHMNITVYFAGMIAGFVYHRYRESRKEFFKSRVQLVLLLATLFFYFFTIFTDWWVVLHRASIPAFLLAIYTTWFKHAWGFLSTMIQVRTALSTSWSRFRNFFSHPIFVVLGKLCYSFYLVHFTVIVQVVGAAKQPIFFSIRVIIENVVTICMWTLIVGTFLCILVELPSNIALHELLESKPEKKPIANSTTVTNGKSKLNASN